MPWLSFMILRLTAPSHSPSLSKPKFLNLIKYLQLFAHPMFEAMEGLLTSCIFRKLPDKEPPYLLRAVLRTVYCAVCGVVAVLLPFFNGDSHLQLSAVDSVDAALSTSSSHAALRQA